MDRGKKLPSQTARRKLLTAAFVSKATDPGKYHDGSGTGLFLRVEPHGSKYWVQRITIRGRRRELGLGSFPMVSLVEARDLALDNKRLVRAGQDPLAEKRKVKATPTFAEAVVKTHAELSPTWRNPKDAAAFLSTLNTYIAARLGRIPVNEVTSGDIRQQILLARQKTPEVARKLAFRTAAVFRWAIAEGHCLTNPATPDALALPRVERQPSHRRALPYNEVADCLKTIRSSRAAVTTKLALEFLVLTATRSGEARLACWEEVDLGSKPGHAVWTIPASRMKMKKAHRVPLSARAVEVLSAAKEISDGSGFVFPGLRSGKPLSDMTLSKLVKDLGFEADVHGFRTSFRTWAQEQTNFPREVAEAALAHRLGDSVEQAYARSDVFEKRRKMMEAWSAFITQKRGEVIELRGRS